MKNKNADLREIYFPIDPKNRAEYVLQRSKKVLADGTKVVVVCDIRPGPEPGGPDEFPSTEVVLRLLGIPFEHPISHEPILPPQWIKDLFESANIQELFITKLCRRLASHLPPSGPLGRIKKKLQDVSSGRPSNLPARLDLLLAYQELVRQLNKPKQWLLSRQKGCANLEKLENAKKEFLKAFSVSKLWWLQLIEDDDVSLDQVRKGSLQSTAKQILAMKFGVSADAIHSRLFRSE